MNILLIWGLTHARFVFEAKKAQEIQHFLYQVTEREIDKEIKQLNVNKSSGHDITPMVLKIEATEYIVKPLSYIFNLSLFIYSCRNNP